MKKTVLTSLVAGAAVLGASMAMQASTAQAASFSCSTAKIIVPWGAGGGTGVIFGTFEKAINATGVKPARKMVTIPGSSGILERIIGGVGSGLGRRFFQALPRNAKITLEA